MADFGDECAAFFDRICCGQVTEDEFREWVLDQREAAFSEIVEEIQLRAHPEAKPN